MINPEFTDALLKALNLENRNIEKLILTVDWAHDFVGVIVTEIIMPQKDEQLIELKRKVNFFNLRDYMNKDSA